jgi:NADH dehydrogenase/NADH:ubiquinone oxidoreductase subunit G
MSAQLKSRREEMAEHILNLCKTRAKKRGCRVKKLEGQDARDSVINAAAWRLILNQQRFGNIRDSIEGNFWNEDGAQRDALIDRALDAERQAYKRATDRAAWEELAPYAVAVIRFKPGPRGRPLPANSVTDVIEREDLEAEIEAEEDAAAAAVAEREQIEAEENEKLRLARNAYAEELSNIRHRRALFLICDDPTASNSTIAARVSMRSVKGIKPETVSKIRDKLTELADGILTRSPDDLLMEELERMAAVKAAADAVRRAERQLHRAQYWATKSAAELAEFRAFAEPLCEALGMSVDDVLGASIEPKAAS